MSDGKALIDHARKQAQIVVNNLDSLDGLWALQACPEPSVHDGDILDLSDPATVERLAVALERAFRDLNLIVTIPPEGLPGKALYPWDAIAAALAEGER